MKQSTARENKRLAIEAREEGKTMTAITLNSLNMPLERPTAASGRGTRRGTPSGIGTPAEVFDGLFVDVQRSKAADGAGQPRERRGLDQIERKAAGTRRARTTATEAAGAMAGLWIGIPFGAVFVLGCLTLA